LLIIIFDNESYTEVLISRVLGLRVFFRQINLD